MLSAILLNVIMLNVIMLNVIMLNVVMLNVIYAECRYVESHYVECQNAKCRYAECHYAKCHHTECPSTQRMPQQYKHLSHLSLQFRVTIFTFTKYRYNFQNLQLTVPFNFFENEISFVLKSPSMTTMSNAEFKPFLPGDCFTFFPLLVKFFFHLHFHCFKLHLHLRILLL